MAVDSCSGEAARVFRPQVRWYRGTAEEVREQPNHIRFLDRGQGLELTAVAVSDGSQCEPSRRLAMQCARLQIRVTPKTQPATTTRRSTLMFGVCGSRLEAAIACSHHVAVEPTTRVEAESGHLVVPAEEKMALVCYGHFKKSGSHIEEKNL